MANKLTDAIFHDEEAARAHYEALRWPDGRVCPHCGIVGDEFSTLLKGKSHRPGLYKCKVKECRKPFSVTIGTLYERSHIPLHKWLLPTHPMCSSKKGISAAQLHRNLGFGSYRTAWFMAHRIREAMRPEDFEPSMGSGGGMVEADETFIGKDPDAPKNRMAIRNMCKVVALVDRDSGRVRSYVVDNVSLKSIKPILEENLAREAHLMTDEASHYKPLGKTYAKHSSVNHRQDEYVNREDNTIHTQTIEGYFGIFKRGMRGIYQHCDKKHLHRYLSEFDFRYSNRAALGIDDTQRTAKAIKATVGKRLLYEATSGREAAQA